jgi:hypothetical protein
MRRFFFFIVFAFLTMGFTKAFGENWTVNVSGGPNANPFPAAQGAWDAVDLGAVIYDNTPGQEENTLTAAWQWQIIEVWWSPTDNTFNASDPSWERLWQGAQAELSNSFVHCRFVDTSVDHSQYSVRLESQFLDRWGYWWVNVRAIGNVANPLLQRSGDYGTRHYDLPSVRLAIDSKNDRGWLAPRGTYDEWKDQDIANDPTKPGRVIFANCKDVNKNRIPDYADGYNRDGFEDAANSGDDITNGEAFAPVKIFIGPNINPDTAVLKINYEYDETHPDGKSSPPMGLYIYPEPQENQPRDPLTLYTPAGEGRIRLWTYIGSTWNKRKGDSMAEGGHWVPPSATTTFPVRSFPFWNEAERSVTLWVEGIKASEAAGDVRIKVDIDPDGGTFNSIGSDTARVTVLKADILADTDHDGTIGESDELGKDIFWTIKGAIVFNNCDNDRGASEGDCHDNVNNMNGTLGGDDDNDLAKIRLSKLLLLPGNWTVNAEISDKYHLRVFDIQMFGQRNAIMGPFPESEVESYVIPFGEYLYDLTDHDLEFAAEAIGFPSAKFSDYVKHPEALPPALANSAFSGLIDVTLQVKDAAGTVMGTDTICLKVAPYLMLGHENSVEKVYASDMDRNFYGIPDPEDPQDPGPRGIYQAILDAGLPESTLQLIPSASYPDPWPQDAFDIGCSTPPSGDPIHFAASLPRWDDPNESPRRLLWPYAENVLLSAGVGQFYTPDAIAIGNPPTASNLNGDYGGNIEIVPPPVFGSQGTIVMGDKDIQRYHAERSSFHPDLPDFLAIQGVQGSRDNGTVTSWTHNSLADASKQWITAGRHWAENDGILDSDPAIAPGQNTWIRTWVTITGGRGKGQMRLVTHSTQDTLTVDRDWDTNPDKSSLYHISSILLLHTDWLEVGHVDSLIKFTPSGKVIAGDTNRGIKLMADLLAKKSAADVSSATDDSVTCNDAGWTTDEWKDGLVYVDEGEGKGQLRRILSNTNDTLYVYIVEFNEERGMLWDPHHQPVGPQTPPSTKSQSHVLIYALQELGQADASGSTAGTIKQSNSNWANNEWRNGFVEITAGAMSGQTRQILSNSDDEIEVLRNWTPVLDNGTSSTGSSGDTLNDVSKEWASDAWVGATVYIYTDPVQERTVTHNTDKALTLNQALQPDPGADKAYVLSLHSPNATTEFRLTNRDAYRAMFIELDGAEDLGSPSMATVNNMIVDSTKNFLPDQWEGGIVLVYHQTGDVEWAFVATRYDASTLMLDRQLAAVPSPTDRYVLVKFSMDWDDMWDPDEEQWYSMPAVTTVWEILTERVTNTLRWYRQWWTQLEGYDYVQKGDLLVTKCQQTYQLVWGTDPTTGGPGLLERMAIAGLLDVKDVIAVPDLMAYSSDLSKYNGWYFPRLMPAPYSGFSPINGFMPTDADNYLPCMANMLIVNQSDTHQPPEQPIVGAVPYPHGPKSGGVDIFQNDLVNSLANIMKVDFVDDWNGYHVLQGGVHCGTAEKRAIPTAHWWNNW